MSHGDSSQRMLIWASEETGHRHLYLLLCQLSPPSSTEDQPSHEDQGTFERVLQWLVLKKIKNILYDGNDCKCMENKKDN